jgi:hypothetical protein
MLWNGNALMLFAHFHTTNSILSIAADLRLLSRHLVGVPKEKRPPMTMRDGASELPHSNEWCDHSQGCTPRRPTARRMQVAYFKVGFPTEFQRLVVTGVCVHPQWKKQI